MHFLSNLTETAWMLVTLPFILAYCIVYLVLVTSIKAAGNIVDVWTDKG